MISKQEGKKLIELARQAIVSSFTHEEPAVADGIAKKFSKPQGAFVTLTIEGELRGCIGYVEPVFPLYETIIRAARAAAFDDPRFYRLQKEELKLIRIEISVLTLPELISVNEPEEYLRRVEIGKDGLIIRGRFGSGLLLPQVFTEHKCSPRTGLEMTCQKAGLASDAWKDLNNRIYKFQALIFSEKESSKNPK